jgi:hypothetical protein
VAGEVAIAATEFLAAAPFACCNAFCFEGIDIRLIANEIVN